MSLRKTYHSVFKAINGEDLAIFTFNYRTKLGDVATGWESSKKYPVYDGVSTFPFINRDLSCWLIKEWRIATSLIPTSVYRSNKIKYDFDNKSTFLFDWICPICLKQKSYFEGHHVISKRDGGVNGHENVLDICKTCHQTITYGCIEDSWYMESAAFYHQLMHFGCEGALRVSFLNYYRSASLEYIEQEKNLFQKTLFFYLLLDEEQEALRKNAKREGRFFYQYYRDIALGIRSYKKEMKLENPELHELFKEQYPWLWD